MYEVKLMSTRDIARETNSSQSAIRRALAKLGVTTRGNSESRQSEHYKKKYEKLKKIETRTCQLCGNEFKITPHKSKKYCSSECAIFAGSNKNKKRIVVHCAYCGKETEKIPSHVDGRKNFCSMECHGKWKSENLVGKNSPTYSRIKTSCGNCGVELEVARSLYHKHEFNYCSMSCMGEHYRLRLLSESNPHWKGGRHGRSEYGPTWWEARRQTIKRDNETCQICGKDDFEDEGVSIHHIRPFRLWEKAEEANNISNLVCLCRECHTFVHSNANVNKQYLIDE